MSELPLTIPDLMPSQSDFLHVLRAAVGGFTPEQPLADWRSVIQLAHAHGVSNFLYDQVRTWEPSCQPDTALMDQWRITFLKSAVKYAHVTAQAHELLKALHDAEVDVIPLKGVLQAERLYTDGACRPMSDIDILVPIALLARARQCLEQLGYATTDFISTECRSKDTRYIRPNTPLPIEVHWRLWSEDDVISEPDPGRIWLGLHEEMLHGIPVLVFSPERQIVYMAQHILHHRLAIPLKAYLDIVLVSRHYAQQLDRTRLDQEKQAWQVAFGAQFVFDLMNDIFEWTLPELLSAADVPDGRYAEERHAALSAALNMTPKSMKITPVLEYCLHASWYNTLIMGIKRVFVSPAELRQLCPREVHRWGVAGGYIWRFINLFSRYGQALKKRKSHDDAFVSDLANFNTRQALSKWIRAQE